MRLRDMKYIDFKHQRENKQNSDKTPYCYVLNEVATNTHFIVIGLTHDICVSDICVSDYTVDNTCNV
jgi:hypothetical protein